MYHSHRLLDKKFYLRDIESINPSTYSPTVSIEASTIKDSTLSSSKRQQVRDEAYHKTCQEYTSDDR